MAGNDTMSSAPAPAPDVGTAPCPPAAHSRYHLILGWAFTLFSSARIVAYLPTMWAIHRSGDSSQHSLWTWFIFLGSNATMALWLLEQGPNRKNRPPIVVSACNALMCAGILVLIVCYR